MKKLVTLSIITLISITAVQAQAWEKKADFPGDGRSAASSFSFSDNGAIGAGYDGEDFRRSFYSYDPISDTWTQIESIGGAVGDGMERNCAASFTIGDMGYIGTGQAGDPFLNDFWAYNHTTNTWAPKPSVGGIDRRCAVGFSIGSKGYIALGQDAAGYRKDVWAFDTTTNTWSQKADFAGTPRRLAAAFTIGGLAYVGTGDDGAFTKDFYVYDPTMNIWNARAPFGGSPRYSTVSFAVNGKGYIACGYDTTLVNRDDFWEYDPIADTWTQMPDFPGGARVNATAFVIDTLAFVGMGYDTSFNYDIWLWGDTTNIVPVDTQDAVTDLHALQATVQLFPNPVTAYANIDIQQMQDGDDLIIEIFDLNGSNVTRDCIVSWSGITSDHYTGKMDVHALPAGTYQCVVHNGKAHKATKFVVIK